MTSLAAASSLQWPLPAVLDDMSLANAATSGLQSMAGVVRMTGERVQQVGQLMRSSGHQGACGHQGYAPVAAAPVPPTIQEAWVTELTQLGGGYKQVMGRGQLLDGSILPPDHLFRVLMEKGMVHDMLVLFNDGNGAAGAAAPVTPTPTQCSIVTAVLMGQGVCGHPGILHGGMTAALIDETCGYLLYTMRHHGLLDFTAVVTASLEVQYKAPIVPDHPVAVTASVKEVVGRKIWIEVAVGDRAIPRTGGEDTTAPAGVAPKLYATARALFIIPRPSGASAATLQAQSDGKKQLGGGIAGAEH